LILKQIIVICITRLETVILQVRARFVSRGAGRGATSASTCKTLSGGVIYQKIIIFVKVLPDREFIFLPLATELAT
jgi:hypothetical protein